jgi:hypothetical protein
MPSQPRPREELDSPWKEALEHFLEWFLALCFPKVHAGIDWNRGYQSLDKELQRIVRDARLGKRLADKLFKVWRKDGNEAWLLVHIEVQARHERTFAGRMYVYSYRIYDLYRRPVVSLAVLCDERPSWRPDYFGYKFEEERRMPYVTSVERLARQEGREKGREEGRREGRQAGRKEGLAEGLQAGIVAVLEARFTRVAAKYKRQLRSEREVERLDALLRAAARAETLDEVFSLLR